MLSFLYRLMRSFQREYGFFPNVVYLNALHYRALRSNLADLNHDQVESFLHLHIVLESDASHPHVGWQEQTCRSQAAGI